MKIKWEDVFNAILAMPPDFRYYEMQEFLNRGIDGIANRAYIERVGIKEALDLEVDLTELAAILENSGYIFCLRCKQIQEDDHKCW